MSTEESATQEPATGKVVVSASAVRRQILFRLIPEAIQRWALASMGERAGDYIDAAHFNFLTLIIAKITAEPDTDRARLLHETPFVIPRSPRRVSAFRRDFDVLAFAEAYQKTLRAVRATREKLRRGASLKVKEAAHQSILPGAPPYDVTHYCSLSPPEVALDYVCRKLKVGRSGEALRKQLQRNLSPKRIKQLRDAVRTEADAVEALMSQFPVDSSAPSASSDVPPSGEVPSSSTP